MTSDSKQSALNGPSQPLRLRPLLEYWAMPWQARGAVRQFGIAAVVACLLVILQPFGSLREPFAWRLVYWLTMLCVMVWLILPALARKLLSNDHVAGMAIVPGALGLYLVASLPMTLVVGTVDIVANASVSDSSVGSLSLDEQMRYLAYLSLPNDVGGYLFVLFAKVAAIGLLSLGLITLFAAGRWAKTDAVSAIAPTLRPGLKFFARLPPAIGTELVLLRMEDHYVRAVTVEGQSLILMRLCDAIAELGDFPGLQVHRSWWIAVEAIRSVDRDGKRLSLVMRDGSHVPVSSSYRSSVNKLLGKAI
jgi:LytTr DNA-binding domain